MGEEEAALNLIALVSPFIQLFVVLVLLLYQQHLRWLYLCSLRREVLCYRGLAAVQDALMTTDYEAAVGAITEWQHHAVVEDRMEKQHHWSLRHFWRMPPLSDEEWA